MDIMLRKVRPSNTAPIASIKPRRHGNFTGLSKELSDELKVVEIKVAPEGTGTSTGTASGTTTSTATGASTGATPSHNVRRMLIAKNAAKGFLPGQPRIRLNTDIDVEDGLLNYLRRAHLTYALDELLPYMRYVFVQTPSFRHIMPLHHQRAHLREVVINENPGLHLVWYYDKIFVKPIPAYFYSQAFWTYIEHADPDVHRAVVGFMRSYNFLIQYEIDFVEACRLRLIPDKPGGVALTYEEFCEFVEPFTQVGDGFVNLRFHYGELRLTRLNKAAMLRGRLGYFHCSPQWGPAAATIFKPLITVFAIFSVALNSMQVALQALDMTEGERWRGLVDASLWFPVLLLVVIAVVILLVLLGMVMVGSRDVISASFVRRRKKEAEQDGRYTSPDGERSHGMIW